MTRFLVVLLLVLVLVPGLAVALNKVGHWCFREVIQVQQQVDQLQPEHAPAGR